MAIVAVSVLVLVLEAVLHNSSLTWLRALRALRALRPLRAASRLEGIKVRQGGRLGKHCPAQQALSCDGKA
jgi:hypothetical protein